MAFPLYHLSFIFFCLAFKSSSLPYTLFIYFLLHCHVSSIGSELAFFFFFFLICFLFSLLFPVEYLWNEWMGFSEVRGAGGAEAKLVILSCLAPHARTLDHTHLLKSLRKSQVHTSLGFMIILQTYSLPLYKVRKVVSIWLKENWGTEGVSMLFRAWLHCRSHGLLQSVGVLGVGVVV